MGIEKIGTEALETAKKISESLKIEEIDKRINIHETKIKKETSITIEDFIDKRIEHNSKEGNSLKGAESIEKNNASGGAYKDLKKSEKYDSNKHEVHHIPANSVSELSKGDGPSIIMDIEDHERTASHGPSKEAQIYRNKQKEYIEKGQFDKAVEMDIKDIEKKFGNKYAKQIDEMKEYIKELKKDGKI